MIPILVTAALVPLGWSLYARRIAWNCLGERPITLSAAMQTFAILMLLPQVPHPLGRLIHALTGVWNAQAFMAHVLCIGADVCIVYHVAWRAQHEEDFIRGFKTHVELPATLAIALMFGLWLSGNGARIPAKCFYLVDLDLSMKIYWLVFTGVLAWMMAYAIRWMFVLRQDPRSRTTVTIYICAGISGLIALLLRAIEAVLPALNNQAGLLAASFFGCAAVTGFAVGAGYSWHVKYLKPARMKWLTVQPPPPPEPKPPKSRLRYSPRSDVTPF